MPSIDLITLQQARDYLQKESGKVGQDGVIGEAITAASRKIMQFCEREFAPATGAATRRFQLDLDAPHVLDLCPYDLRNATSVTLHPEGSAPRLLSTSEYLLEPTSGWRSSVYTSIRISDLVPIVSDTVVRFGYALVDVAGAWGFSTVPEDVQHWCKVTVWSWIRGDVQAFTTSYSVDQGRYTFPEQLPRSVAAGLRDSWARAG